MDIKFINNLTRSDPFDQLNCDVTFDTTQDLATVSNTDYVKQQYAKLFISSLGNDPYFYNFGTFIPMLIFTNVTNTIVQNEITNTIIGAISYQLTIETSLVPSERVSAITDMQISQPEKTSSLSSLGCTVAVTLQLENGASTIVSVGG